MRKYNKVQIKELFKDKNVLVAACEAGASQILSSLIRNIEPNNITYILEGPAIDIFDEKLPGIKNSPLSEEVFKKADMVITGTSLIPELERDAIKITKTANKYCISLLDHWIHYKERFIPVIERDKKSPFSAYLPDEIWITDDYAKEVAVKAGIPEDKLFLIDNFYLTDFIEKARNFKVDLASKNVLYICEPVYDDLKLLYGDGNAWGYNEYDLVKDCISSLPLLEKYFKKIIFRMHPNEDQEKYNKIISDYRGNISVELSSFKKKTLEEDCMQADYVVGVESMALVLASILNKKVFSCLPGKAKKPCVLPHKEIIHITTLKDIVNFIGGA